MTGERDPRACQTCGLWQRTEIAARVCADPVHDAQRQRPYMELERRPFGEAVRYALGLSLTTPDDDVIAHAVMLRQTSERGPGAHHSSPALMPARTPEPTTPGP